MTKLQALNDEQLDELMRIHRDLSPESLCGDGELPDCVWRPRKTELDAQLVSFQQAHGLSQDEVDEESVYSEYDSRLEKRRRGQLPQRRARP